MVRFGLARSSRALKASRVAWRSAWRCCSVSHLAVFSVGMPTASARTSAAAADGASPTTEPTPCWASHAARTPAMAVDFPLPAGPTSTSSGRPEVTTWTTAAACSADSTRPVSSSGAAHDGPSEAGVDARRRRCVGPASTSRVSASRISTVE